MFFWPPPPPHKQKHTAAFLFLSLHFLPPSPLPLSSPLLFKSFTYQHLSNANLQPALVLYSTHHSFFVGSIQIIYVNCFCACSIMAILFPPPTPPYPLSLLFLQIQFLFLFGFLLFQFSCKKVKPISKKEKPNKKF